jgi:hypothetical protein
MALNGPHLYTRAQLPSPPPPPPLPAASAALGARSMARRVVSVRTARCTWRRAVSHPLDRRSTIFRASIRGCWTSAASKRSRSCPTASAREWRAGGRARGRARAAGCGANLAGRAAPPATLDGCSRAVLQLLSWPHQYPHAASPLANPTQPEPPCPHPASPAQQTGPPHLAVRCSPAPARCAGRGPPPPLQPRCRLVSSGSVGRPPLSWTPGHPGEGSRPCWQTARARWPPAAQPRGQASAAAAG